MAKTFTLQSKSYDGRYLKLTCTQTQNISANQSTVAWVLESVGGNSNYYYTGPTTVTIGGTQVYYRGRTGAHEFPCAKGSVSGSVTVSHGTNGQKSVEVSLKTAIYTKTLTEKTGTWTLDTIPRQADLTAAPHFTDEEDPTITYKNPAGTAVTSLELCIALDDQLTQALPYQAVSKTGTNFTYRLQEADRQFLWEAMGKNNSVEVCFCLRTVIGGVIFYDKLWRKVTLVNASPVIAPQVAEADTEVKGANPSAFIRYLSDVQFTTGAQGRKGASIVSQSVSCGGQTVKKASGTLQNIHSGQLVFAATDSRGNHTEYPLNLPFVSYIKPTCSFAGNQPDTQGNFTLSVSGLCYTGEIPGLGQNQIQAEYCYRASGGEYSQWLPMTVEAGENTYTATAEFTGLDYRTTYTFLCRVKDALTVTTTDETAIKAMPVFDWSEKDFRFHVPVSAPSLTLDGVQMDYIAEQGTKNGWLYRKWQGGLAECWYRKEHTVAISNAWGSLYAGTNATGRTDYPFSFAEKPHEAVTVKSSVPSVFAVCSSGGLGDNTLSQTASYNAVRPTAYTEESTLFFEYYVVGRWK